MRVVHPFPVAVVLATSVGMAIIAHGGFPGGAILIRLFAVVLCSQVTVGALNDYLDRHHDVVTQPDKPIPSGLISPATALGMSIVAALLLVPLALSFGAFSLVLAASGTVAGVAYDVWLKPTPLSVLGYIAGFLLLVTWIWRIAGHPHSSFWLVYPAGAVLLLAAHLANSFPDIETDRILGQRGAAVLLGVRGTWHTILGSYALVAVAGMTVALNQKRWGAVILIALAGGMWFLMRALCADAENDVASRERLFRFVAPGIAVLATGCLLALP